LRSSPAYPALRLTSATRRSSSTPGNQVDADGIVRDGRRIGQLEADVEGSHVLRDNNGHRIGNVTRLQRG
jgi:hypothetical protein